MNVIQGVLSATDKRFAVVVSRFNRMITERLLEGAVDCITRHGGQSPDVVWVPGALEIAMATQRIISTTLYDGVVCLGAVIKGETDHYDYVAGNTASGIAQVARESEIPVTFGVLTTNTVEQAMNRAGIKNGNAGYDAALSMIDIVSVCEQIGSLSGAQRTVKR